jgi:hypothetical protein
MAKHISEIEDGFGLKNKSMPKKKAKKPSKIIDRHECTIPPPPMARFTS